MANTTNVTAPILDALAELNQQLPPVQQLPVSSDTPLFGYGGRPNNEVKHRPLYVIRRILDRAPSGRTQSSD